MVGAGIVGAAIAARLAVRGIDVCVVDRGGPAAGTSSSGEGNVLVSDKLPGPELELALLGRRLWRQVGERGGEAVELEDKGGLVVARDAAELEALTVLADAQRSAGAAVETVGSEDLRQHEPALAEGLAGGAYYPQDCQVQPMLAAAFHLEELTRAGGRFVGGAEVLGAGRDRDGAITALSTTKGDIAVDRFVVNAAGPWAALVAARLGARLSVEPRRGHVLVTEPVHPLVRHKVYEAGYVGSIHGKARSWTTSAVVESTRSATMLLGSSREFVGFSDQPDQEIIADIAARAIALFPMLAEVRLLRCYVGFRPATPDRLPIIGPDPAVGRLLHASGHEGAGVGLAQATAEIVEALVAGEAPPLDIDPFAPGRFAEGFDTPASVELAPASNQDPANPANPATRRPPPATVPVGVGTVQFRFDGRELRAAPGVSIAGALLANGERSWRATRRGGQRRGIFCGIGTCFDCLVEVNGRRAVRACCTPLRDGDDVRSSDSYG